MDSSLNMNEEASFSSNNSPGFSSKSRKPNWTDAEIRTLILEYDKHRRIMKSRGHFKTKDGQVVNSTEKHKIWETITEAVNRSNPEGNTCIGGFSQCTRTPKEVIKKWVNLINKMRADVASVKANSGSQLCPTSKAVHTIVNTDDPLEQDNINGHINGGMTIIKIERESFDEDQYNSNDYQDGLHNDHMSSVGYIDPCTVDEDNDALDRDSDSSNNYVQKRKNNYPVKYDQENAMPVGSLKRKLGHIQMGGATGIDESRYLLQDWADKRQNTAKRMKTGGNDATAHGGLNAIYKNNSVASSDCVESQIDEITGEIAASSDHARYVRELQIKKLQLEIDRMVLENQKLEIEKQRMVIEKETALLVKEKINLELEIMKKNMKEN